jgi:hypothetical protein
MTGREKETSMSGPGLAAVRHAVSQDVGIPAVVLRSRLIRLQQVTDQALLGGQV